MFQNFEMTTRPENGGPRVSALRQAMAEIDCDAFLVPRADAHRGENVAPCDERLAWLTGFTGSAGMAAVTGDRAVVFVDGRYTLQVRAQTLADVFEYQNIPRDKLSAWLTAALPEGGRIGFDPWLHTDAEIGRLQKALGPGFDLVETANLVDQIWADRPAQPVEPIVVHPLEFAGDDSAAKRARLAEKLRADDIGATILSLPDSIAWLLNIRGSDIARTPVARAFAILNADASLRLFVTDTAAAGADLRAHLGDDITLAATADLLSDLDALRGRVALDRDTAPVALRNALSQAEIVWQRDPCIIPKAVKNTAELNGSRAAHLRDGAAMVEFLAWLDATAPGGALTEIDVATKLEAFRSKANGLRDISFETISGAGANGAIIHYRVTTETNAPLLPDSIYLVDSGGQYLDGTTDITRTIAIGTPPEGAARAYTLVLKGMIALSALRFPSELSGRDIDALARVALWQHGFDYDHGTGHGVGAYLGVHEGPISISRRSTEPLLPGMILSNEPGYYREGAFGIRIENLIVVEPPSTPEGGDREMLSFETLTFAPLDRRLIDASLMTGAEIAWLNAYHAETLARLADHVSIEAAAWLVEATRPI